MVVLGCCFGDGEFGFGREGIRVEWVWEVWKKRRGKGVKGGVRVWD